jgi:hypothetical protein
VHHEGRKLLERLDPHAGVRNALKDVAADKREWAGIPMPLNNERLVIEPSYPYAGLADIGKPSELDEEIADRAEGLRRRRDHYGNPCRFHCASRGSWIELIENTATGKVVYGQTPAIHHLTHDLQTLGSSDAWGIEQEYKAVDLLATLVSHRQFKQYMLTGSFLETSRRSRVTYMFRRLKPTVALGVHGTNPEFVDLPGGKRRRVPTLGRVGNQLRVLAALCLHPIAYYAGSWAGAMCPTDDVVAHLMLMRGDEAMFWRRANQHPAWLPEAGL